MNIVLLFNWHYAGWKSPSYLALMNAVDRKNLNVASFTNISNFDKVLGRRMAKSLVCQNSKYFNAIVEKIG